MQRANFWSRRIGRLVAVGGLCLLFSACGSSLDDGSTKVNGSIHVPAGRAPADVVTVNGSIDVDDHAAVANATSVNGAVALGAHAHGAALETVNGAIALAEDAQAADLKTVNGALTLKPGADVTGSLVNVAGKISITAAHVGGMIHTVAGDITLSGATKVDGGILVQKPSGSGLGSDVPTIVIGPGVTVGGDLRFERKVKLFVSDKATIGNVSGATAVTFSGDTPPNAT